MKSDVKKVYVSVCPKCSRVGICEKGPIPEALDVCACGAHCKPLGMMPKEEALALQKEV